MTAGLSFFVAGAAQPKGSARAYTYRRKDGRVGARVTADNEGRLGAWQSAVAWGAARALPRHPAPWPSPAGMSLRCAFLLRPPVRRRGRGEPTVKPDLDKLLRAVCDALTGVVWVDDAQVLDLSAVKAYAAGHEAPGVLVSVSWSEGVTHA
jgi:Holliday junction resolvase RusA-like endonuclease